MQRGFTPKRVDGQPPVIWLSGASSGIGHGLALHFLQDGARLAVSARNRDKLESLADLIPGSSERLLVLPVDATDAGQMEDAYRQLHAQWGPPDMVVANAGTHQHMELGDIDYQACRAIIEINLLGAIRMLTLPLPDMVQRGSGHLIGVASLAGYRGLPASAAYGASKSGLITFLEGLRFDLAGTGVSVTIVNPGFVRTPLTDRNPFEMPCLVSVDEAVAAIRDGLRAGASEIHFPKRFSRAMKLLRVLPYPVYQWLVRRITGKGA